MLPFASEVKLASLLTRENGNMNAVVQQILDSGTNEDADKETRVIDLTDEESAKNDSAATQVQNLAKIPVDTNMLQKDPWNSGETGISFSLQQFVVFSKTRKEPNFSAW